MSFAVKEDLLANVGGGFVQTFVEVNQSKPCVNIIQALPVFLMFFLFMFIGALFGLLSFSTFAFLFFVAYAGLAFVQKQQPNST